MANVETQIPSGTRGNLEFLVGIPPFSYFTVISMAGDLRSLSRSQTAKRRYTPAFTLHPPSCFHDVACPAVMVGLAGVISIVSSCLPHRLVVPCPSTRKRRERCETLVAVVPTFVTTQVTSNCAHPSRREKDVGDRTWILSPFDDVDHSETSVSPANAHPAKVTARAAMMLFIFILSMPTLLLALKHIKPWKPSAT